MAIKKNFYAVKNGRRIGIYKTWAECQQQVQGYPNALFKGFATLTEAESYMSYASAEAEKNEAAGVCYIYVDGSYFHGRYSWGIAAYIDGRLIHTANGVGKSADAAQLHNVAGEVEAAMQAVKWAVSEGITCPVICHDYIGISEWAQKRWKTNTPTTAAYADFMAAYVDQVSFHKVTGHTGVEGNELADKLARQALEID